VENQADPCLRNWEGARAFLEVVRCGSFRSAAQALQLSVNTLRRHVEEFEREAGHTLFTRHVDGVRLTAEGELLVGAGKRMEAASFEIARARNIGASMSGEVRLGVTEGLGTFWLAPRLVEYQRKHPGLLIDLRCAMRPADVLRLETEIAIQLERPAVKDLHIVKLGRLHSMPCASREYLEAHGAPKDFSDIKKNHHLVLQVADQLVAAQEFARLFPDTPQVGTVSFRSNVSSAHSWLIARGAGIGILPSYAFALSRRIVPIDLGYHFTNDIWLAYHPDAAKIARVRSLIDWLIEAFSPKRFPWFADEFVHPRDFPPTVDGQPLPSLFDGFSELDEV
jgi:DNA-binding transcriptional LysR family regulator